VKPRRSIDKGDRPEDIYQRIVRFIDGGEAFVVATILAAEGSTPRKAGVNAIIDDTGEIWGTLGGGACEARAQQFAVEVCGSQCPILFDFDLLDDSVDGARPICGGSMRMLLDPTAAEDRDSYFRAAEAMRTDHRGVLLTSIRATPEGPPEVSVQWFDDRAIPADAAFPGAEAIGECLAGEEPRRFCRDTRSGRQAATEEVLVQPIVPRAVLLIAGGGHIGQLLASQGAVLGFAVTVMDGRPEFTGAELFPHEVTVLCGDLSTLISDFRITDQTYIVIVTHGHKHDAEALQACINSPAAYIGMIGSRRKVRMLRESFVRSGIATEGRFDEVFAPIGLDVGAVTVPEIATSIAAQLIAVRRKGADYSSVDRMARQ